MAISHGVTGQLPYKVHQNEADRQTDRLRVHSEPYNAAAPKEQQQELTCEKQSSVIVLIVIVRLSELVISFLSSCFQCLDLNWIALSIEVAGTAPVSSTLFFTRGITTTTKF